MAVTRIYKFASIEEAQTFLNGGLILGSVLQAPGGKGLAVGLAGLVGKTLKFTSPSAATVTFVASDGSGGSAEPGVGSNPDKSVLLFKDLKLQIQAAIATVTVFSYNGRLALIEATPTSGVALDKTGTANAILGIDRGTNTVGKLFAPPPSSTPPCWTWAYSGNENGHTIYTLE